jgi:hypothetical protein
VFSAPRSAHLFSEDNTIRILTTSNQTFDLNQLPEKVDDLRYCVLDYSDHNNIDYYWPPLVFLDTFSSPCADIRIGEYNIQMPLDWSVVVGDKHGGDLEAMKLVDVMDKDFDVFVFNPINGYMPQFLNIEIINIFNDVRWCFPKLKTGHYLAVPLGSKPSPVCAYFIQEVGKSFDILDIRELV